MPNNYSAKVFRVLKSKIPEFSSEEQFNEGIEKDDYAKMTYTRAKEVQPSLGLSEQEFISALRDNNAKMQTSRANANVEVKKSKTITPVFDEKPITSFVNPNTGKIENFNPATGKLEKSSPIVLDAPTKKLIHEWNPQGGRDNFRLPENLKEPELKSPQKKIDPNYFAPGGGWEKELQQKKEMMLRHETFSETAEEKEAGLRHAGRLREKEVYDAGEYFKIKAQERNKAFEQMQDENAAQRFGTGLVYGVPEAIPFKNLVVDIPHLLTIVDVAERSNRGEKLSDNDRNTLLEFNEYQKSLQKNFGIAGNIGAGIPESVEFMAEMLTTAGIGKGVAEGVVKALKKIASKTAITTTGKAVIKGAEEFAETKVGKFIAKAAETKAGDFTAKQLAKLPGKAVETVVQTAAMPNTVENIQERNIGQYTVDESGNATRTNPENYIAKGFLGSLSEVGSEKLGEGINEAAKVFLPKKLTNLFLPLDADSGLKKAYANFAKGTEFYGMPTEFATEMVDATVQQMINGEPVQDAWTWENVLTTLGSVATISAGMKGIESGAKGIDKASRNREYEKVVNDFSNTSQTEEEKIVVEQVIDAVNAKNAKERSQKLANIDFSNTTKEFREAALDTIVAKTQLDSEKNVADSLERYNEFSKGIEDIKQNGLGAIEEAMNDSFGGMVKVADNNGDITMMILQGNPVEDETVIVQYADGSIKQIASSEINQDNISVIPREQLEKDLIYNRIEEAIQQEQQRRLIEEAQENIEDSGIEEGMQLDIEGSPFMVQGLDPNGQNIILNTINKDGEIDVEVAPIAIPIEDIKKYLPNTAKENVVTEQEVIKPTVEQETTVEAPNVEIKENKEVTIPTDKTGAYLFEQAPADVTISELKKDFDTTDELLGFTNASISALEKQIQRVASPKFTGNPNVDLVNKRKSKEEVAALTEKLNYWRGVRSIVEIDSRAERANVIPEGTKGKDLALQTEVHTPYDVVLQYFIGGGNVSKESVMELLNSEKELANRRSVTKDDAPTIDDIAHSLWENNESIGDTDSFREAVESVLASFQNRNQMAYDLNNRHKEQLQQAPADYVQEEAIEQAPTESIQPEISSQENVMPIEEGVEFSDAEVPFQSVETPEQISNKKFKKISKLKFNQLIKRLKQTGLAKDVVTDPVKMQNVLEGLVGKDNATRFMFAFNSQLDTDNPQEVLDFIKERYSNGSEYVDILYKGQPISIRMNKNHGWNFNRNSDNEAHNLSLVNVKDPSLKSFSSQNSKYENRQIDNIKDWEDAAEQIIDFIASVEEKSDIDTDWKELNSLRFLQTPQGEVYGFVTPDGVIYLEESKMNANTPIHEFGHLWQSFIEKNNAELYQKGVDLIKDSPYMDIVKSNPAYSGLSEKQQVDEAMAMAIGDKGEIAVNEKGLGQQLLDWINEVWEWIGDRLGIQNLSSAQIQDLTLEQFSEGAVADLLSGEDITAKIKEAEKDIDTNPTEAQKEAGNYKKGHVNIQGFDITIEQPKGSIRKGVDENGRAWESKMNNTYGYFKGTTGKDSDHIDVFIGNNPTTGKVFVIDQINPKTGDFDEHKVMLGFNSIDEAKENYLANYEKDWKGLGNITEVEVEDFKNWLNSSTRKLKPFADYKINSNFVGNGSNRNTRETGLDNRRSMGSSSKRLSLGEQSENSRIEQTLEASNRSGSDEATVPSVRGGWNKHAFLQRLEGEAQRNSTWINDVSEVADINQPLIGGFENEPYISNDGKSVIKLNNFAFLNDNDTDYEHTRDLDYFINRLASHNELFPEDKYEILGFAKNSKGDVSIALKQPFVDNATLATQEEIDEDLAKRGFEKVKLTSGVNTGLTGYTNGKYELTDVKPENVLKDSDGSLRFIDLDISPSLLSQEIDNFKIEAPPSELDQIKEEAIKNGTFMKAPNGNSTNLTEKQWLQVRSQAFIDWFGDWENDPENASKVVDENGEPMVVYHGTGSEFEEFKKPYNKYSYTESGGNFFTSDKKLAEKYAKKAGGSRVMEVFLDMKNPTEYDAHGKTYNEFGAIDGDLSYSEIIIRNIKDSPSGKDKRIRESDLFVIGNNLSTQIKSATENVGDFDAENPDIRFQFIGEKGAANLDQLEEATIRLDNLAVAREMEDLGKDEKVIKLATGWEKGADGKWRYEIPDVKNIDKQVFNSLHEGEDYNTAKLSDLIGGDSDLFKYYPQLKNVDVARNNIATSANWSSGGNGQITINNLLTSLSAKPSLLHEIQHAIQDIEGFARGGSENRMRGYSLRESKKILEKEYSHLPSYQTAKKDNNIDKWVIGMIRVTGKGITPIEAYSRLAGEVEARNVQARMNMTLEERRNSLAKETEDVAQEDQIFINDSLGLQESSDIPFQTVQEQPIVGEELSRLEKLRERWQDAQISVREMQKEIEEVTGNKIPDQMNVYEAMNHAAGRSMYQGEVFERQFVKPMLQAAKEAVTGTDISYKELVDYIIAKHIPERNEYFQEKNNDTNDYAGETEFVEETGKTPEEYIKEIESKLGKEKTDNLWGSINKATDFSLNQTRESGLIDKETYDELKGRWNYYVPLRGWEESDKDNFEYVETVNSGTFSNPLKKIKGRKSKAENPFAYIEQLGYSSIAQAEKNRYKKALFNLATYARSKDFGGIGFQKVYAVEAGKDEEGNPVYQYQEEVPSEDLFEEGKVKIETNTSNRGKIENWKAKQHEVDVYMNGRRYTILFDNPRIANAINKTAVPKMPMLEPIRKATQWLTQNMTTKNPAFAVWNLARDFQLANATHLMGEGAGYAAQFNKNFINPKLYAAIARHVRGKRDGTGDKYDKIVDDFAKMGGKTGFTAMKNIDEIKRKLKKEIKPDSTFKKVLENANLWKHTGDLFNGVSEFSELLSRVATYKTSLDRGKTPFEAITDAKNVTTNFNRKGNNIAIPSAIYGFVNAAIQGSHRIAQVAKKNKKAFAGGAATLFSMGFLSHILNLLLDDDDEYRNQNDYNKYVNWYIPGIDIQLPLPQGLRGIYSAGVIAAQYLTGEKELDTALFDALNYGTKDFVPEFANPLSYIDYKSGKGGLQFGGIREAFPTALVPIYDVATNSTFSGGTVRREPFSKKLKESTPSSQLYKKNVNPFIQSITEKIAEAGGLDTEINKNTKYISEKGENVNWIYDWNPSDIEHITTSILAGRGKFYNDLLNLSKNIVDYTEGDTDAIATENIPVANRMVKHPNKERIEIQAARKRIEEAMFHYDGGQNLLKAAKNPDLSEEAREKALDKYTEWMGTDWAMQSIPVALARKKADNLLDQLDDLLGKYETSDTDKEGIKKQIADVTKQVSGVEDVLYGESVKGAKRRKRFEELKEKIGL